MQKCSLTSGRLCSLFSKAVPAFHIPPCSHYWLSLHLSLLFLVLGIEEAGYRLNPRFCPPPHLCSSSLWFSLQCPCWLMILCFMCISDTCAHSLVGSLFRCFAYFIYILGMSHIINMISRYSLTDFSLLCGSGQVGSVSTQVCVCGGYRSISRVSPRHTLSVFETVSVIDPRDLIGLYLLARKPLGSTCLHASKCQVTGTCSSDLAFYDSHRSSCLYSKHLSHGAISPALAQTEFMLICGVR